MGTNYARDIEALHKRLNSLEQGGVPVAQAAPPAEPEDAEALAAVERRLNALESQNRRIDELHAELSRLSQGVDKLAALEAEVASLKAAR